MTISLPHISVFEHELVDALNVKEGHRVIDCTAGYGGHTQGLLKQVGKTGQVIAFDRDPSSIAFLQKKFEKEIRSGNLLLIQEPFSSIKSNGLKHRPIHGICADLGVSSPQLDQGERGFSVKHHGPLDMRMDPNLTQTAADIVNLFEKNELIKLFRDYGEEPKAKFIADAIIKSRYTKPIETTSELAKLISDNVFYKVQSRRHPATRVFQALRIAVNDELGELETLCREGFELLESGGRLSIITFHSLEDRIVKNSFRSLSQSKIKPSEFRDLPYLPSDWKQQNMVRGKVIKPFPMNPSENEISRNPRSRSAKLRTIERI